VARRRRDAEQPGQEVPDDAAHQAGEDDEHEVLALRVAEVDDVAAVGTALVYRLTNRVPRPVKNSGFRWGQIGSASLVSLAHGTNDAQKTMGVIFLALVAHVHTPRKLSHGSVR